MKGAKSVKAWNVQSMIDHEDLTLVCTVYVRETVTVGQSLSADDRYAAKHPRPTVSSQKYTAVDVPAVGNLSHSTW